jgi:PHD/YefM family antitoxin component YafN of YafNO toxin-antitoxin module
MKVLSVSEAKMTLSHLLEGLGIQKDEVIITRNGRAAGVLLAPLTFESWQETLAVVSDEELMREIRAGLAALAQPVEPIPPEQLFGE